jgi:ABC-type transport system involved in cytochrome c biogenesis permease component
MEARLAARRRPSFALVFALAVTILLGVTIGYLLKPVSTIAGPVRFIAVTTAGESPSANSCIVVGGHKGC